MKETKALIIDDTATKRVAIKRALEFCGISDILLAKNMEMGFEMIYENEQQGIPINLVVTDMQYPLDKGEDIDPEAGFKFIERLKKEEKDIPVIICSSINYQDSDVLGHVWYHESRDINMEFKRILSE